MKLGPWTSEVSTDRNVVDLKVRRRVLTGEVVLETFRLGGRPKWFRVNTTTRTRVPHDSEPEAQMQADLEATSTGFDLEGPTKLAGDA